MFKLKSATRKHLCISGLLERARAQFKKIRDPLASKKTRFTLPDCLMSGLALFGMKYPSLLQFDKDIHNDKIVRHNLRHLYQIEHAPSDTYFRERLDDVNPVELQKVIDRIITQLQRAKVLETYRYFDDHYLVSIDGTGYFSSHEVHCDSCCVKNHRDGRITYYHQMLAAVLIHPDIRSVFPLALEPITKKDGMAKNDCEHNALKRLLINLRRSHPHLKLIVTLDGLYADGVIIKLLKSLDIRYIIRAKPTDLAYLYELYQTTEKSKLTKTVATTTHDYTWRNGLPINDSHHDVNVNLLYFEETVSKKQKEIKKEFAWVSDLILASSTVSAIMRGGRARWKIENETFNTLKNQGYQFEHNFGHGNKNLSVVFAYLMFIAFLIDQVQEYSCKHFKAALKKRGRLSYLWEKIRGLFLYYFVESWSDLYTVIIEDRGAYARDLLDSG